MLNKIKTWIIKKLGGYTSAEYNRVQNELTIANEIITRFINKRGYRA